MVILLKNKRKIREIGKRKKVDIDFLKTVGIIKVEDELEVIHMSWKPKTDVSPAELKKMDESIALVENQKKDAIFRLGESFYSANKDNAELGEAYLKQVDVVNKLEYNRRVWINRKMKAQGMRICDKCSNVLPYESNFCNQCGSKLEMVPEELMLISGYTQSSV